MEQPFGSLGIGIKKLYRKLVQFFFWNFPATFRNIWSGVVSKYTCRPSSWKFSTKLLTAGILQNESASACFCKKYLYGLRYLRNFSEFQKCARLESVVFGMQFTKTELHYRLQCRHLRKLFGVNIAKFPEELLFETPVQVIGFLTELYNEEISPFTLLKSDSSREALLAILENRKTNRK